MVQVHMTEAEVASDFAAALEKVRQGLEVVVEHDHHAIAVLKPAEPPRRKISECIEMLPADSTAVIDPEFAADVEAAIAAHREPDPEGAPPPAWDWSSILPLLLPPSEPAGTQDGFSNGSLPKPVTTRSPCP